MLRFKLFCTRCMNLRKALSQQCMDCCMCCMRCACKGAWDSEMVPSQ